MVPLSHKSMAFLVIMGVSLSPYLADHSFAGSQKRQYLRAAIGSPDYLIAGKITNINGETYTLRTSGGDKVKLEITDDTNMFCESRSDQSEEESANGQSMSATNDQGAGVSHDKEGQSGFRLGDCPFEVGDVVKAETTDMGYVSFMRSWSQDDEVAVEAWREDLKRGGSREKSRSTAGMGLPQQYLVLPAGALGGMAVSGANQYTVKTSDNKEIGNVYKVVVNDRGDLSYAVIRLKEDDQLKPVPMTAIKMSPDEKTVTLKITRNQVDRLPGYQDDDLSITNIRQDWERATTQRERKLKERARFNRQGTHFGPVYERYYEQPYERLYSGSYEDDPYKRQRGRIRDRHERKRQYTTVPREYRYGSGQSRWERENRLQ